MAIKPAFTQPGEVLPTTEHPRLPESRKKLAGIQNRCARIRRHHPRIHHIPGSLKGEIDGRRKIDIESQRAAIVPNDSTLLPIESPIPGSKHLRGCRGRTDHVPQPVDSPALKIDASK